MARIAGVDLPKNKRIEIALTYIFGIGLKISKDIIKKIGISPDIRVKDLSDEDVIKIRHAIDDEYKVEGDLRTEIQFNIKRLKEIGCYRGIRHIRKLPSRGQRTKTNARTKRGKRKTVGSSKKEVSRQPSAPGGE